MPSRLFCPSCLKWAAVLVLASVVSAAQSPNPAQCSYTFFPTVFSGPPLSRYGQFFPFGINDFRTAVGGAFQAGFIRWANGGYTFPAGTGSLVDRNDKGVSIGYDNGNSPIILQNGAVIPLTVIIGANTISGPGLVVSRINKWNSIVGWYGDNAGISRGYKRFANGHGIKLDFPAHFTQINSGTFLTGINDLGMIVGFTQIPYHAFVYYKGKWVTLRFPNATATSLSGISNAGAMIGNAEFKDGSTTGFRYKNGKFETITPPGTTGPGVGSAVVAISLRTGLILGLADLQNSPRQGFIAECN